MNKLRRRVISALLAILNSRFLNQTPCRYEFVGNLDAFSRENLEYEDKARPGITVRTILDEAALYKTCPVGNRLMVLEGESFRDATAMDVHELRISLQREKEKS